VLLRIVNKRPRQYAELNTLFFALAVDLTERVAGLPARFLAAGVPVLGFFFEATPDWMTH
jgi:hypothetical protein